MKARIYVALICSGDDVSLIPDDVARFLSGKRIQTLDKRIALRSPHDEIEFDDLGECLHNYCLDKYIPDFSSLTFTVEAYVQVVPEIDDDVLRVYLKSEFLEALANKALGLEIHTQ
ncbi:hypothetical protein [Terrihabitans rhizophilus]|uniref:Uncharacterized protein n=1 Tax=Terrihabitans rhizophilus TaxID=3092662 RepID=A0ABU4RN75_9HYPH|nr:hypothetical protein [Terrihabitans sp. PJ23]MDX6806285.1 hypothetical protein [Terrihabitans sp. PJ23]